MTLAEFEARVAAMPPPDDGWQYWNWLLPQTAPQYFVWQIELFLRDWKDHDRKPESEAR